MLTKDLCIWTMIALLTLVNLVIQFFANLTDSYQLMTWGVWVVLVLGLLMLTDKFVDIKLLVKDAYTELKKVVWPSRQETIQTTLIVIVMVAITGLILWLLDNFMIWLIAKLARIG